MNKEKQVDFNFWALLCVFSIMTVVWLLSLRGEKRTKLNCTCKMLYYKKIIVNLIMIDYLIQ